MISLWQNDGVGIWQSQKNSFGDSRPYGFNVGMHVGDDPACVLARRALLLTHLSPFGVRGLVWVNQVHGNDIYRHERPLSHLICADAIISRQREVGLCIMSADCVPIALFDGEQVACIHAGHQGLAKGVIAKTAALFSHRPVAYIGACISGGCYELPHVLGEQIVKACIKGGYNGDEAWTALTVAGTDKVLVDVGQLARSQLAHLGVTVLNDSQPCSYEDNYHSHRRSSHEGGVSGRMALVIAQF